MGFFLLNSRFNKGDHLDSMETSSHESFSLNGEREVLTLGRDHHRLLHAKGFTEDYVKSDAKSLEVYSGYTFKNSDRPLIERLKKRFEEYRDQNNVREPHNFMRISASSNQIDAEVDLLGGTTLFYRVLGQDVFLCNEFEPLAGLDSKDLTLNHLAIDHFLCFGTTINGETFFNEIKMVPLGHRIQFTFIEYQSPQINLFKVKYASPQIKGDSIDSISIQFKELLTSAINTMVKDFKIDSLSLSGGADSRLSMALIDEELRRKITFRTAEFDPPSKRSFYDLKVAQMLAQEFSLNHEVYKDDFHGGSFESFLARYPLRHRPKLGGVYGGEFFGGESFGVLPFKRTEFNLEIATALLENLNRLGRSKFHIDDFENWSKSLDGSSKEFFASVLVFRNSFMSSIYEGDLHWNSPCMIPQKVFSIFNLGEVIWELVNLPYDCLADYRLYIELYKSLEPRYTEIPFDAAMVRKPSRPFKDAEKEFDLSEVEIRSPESTHPISLENLFQDQKFRASLEKSEIVELESFDNFRDDFDVEYQRRLAVLELWEKKFL